MNIKKGITLVALVVTIVILLILAGVTIALVLGPDGMLEKARETKIDTRYGTILDKVHLREADLEISANLNETGEGKLIFISRLQSEGLIIPDEDFYDEDTSILKIGKVKDDEYKYSIRIPDEKTVASGLKDTDQPGNEYLKDMALIVKPDWWDEVTLYISNTSGLSINWDFGNGGTWIDLDGSPNPTHQYENDDLHTVLIRGVVNGNSTFGDFIEEGLDDEREINIDEIDEEQRIKIAADSQDEDYDYSQPIVGIQSWGENGFTRFGYMGYTKIIDIPSPTLKSFEKVTHFNWTFAETYIGDLEEHSSRNDKVLGNQDDFKYLNCLAEIPYPKFKMPKNFFANCPNLVSVKGMFQWSEIEEIPKGIFSESLNITDYSYCFMGSYRLNGMAPNPWLRSGLTGTGCFLYCENLSNYDVIPVQWGGPGPGIPQ